MFCIVLRQVRNLAVRTRKYSLYYHFLKIKINKYFYTIDLNSPISETEIHIDQFHEQHFQLEEMVKVLVNQY